MRVGPTSPEPTPMSIIGGAPTRVYSSAKTSCSSGVAPRPPYSRGQWRPAQPPSKSLPCHQRPKRTVGGLLGLLVGRGPPPRREVGDQPVVDLALGSDA